MNSENTIGSITTSKKIPLSNAALTDGRLSQNGVLSVIWKEMMST